jgi:hypothetical protein
MGVFRIAVISTALVFTACKNNETDSARLKAESPQGQTSTESVTSIDDLDVTDCSKYLIEAVDLYKKTQDKKQFVLSKVDIFCMLPYFQLDLNKFDPDRFQNKISKTDMEDLGKVIARMATKLRQSAPGGSTLCPDNYSEIKVSSCPNTSAVSALADLTMCSEKSLGQHEQCNVFGQRFGDLMTKMPTLKDKMKAASVRVLVVKANQDPSFDENQNTLTVYASVGEPVKITTALKPIFGFDTQTYSGNPYLIWRFNRGGHSWQQANSNCTNEWKMPSKQQLASVAGQLTTQVLKTEAGSHQNHVCVHINAGNDQFVCHPFNSPSSGTYNDMTSMCVIALQ